MKQLKEVEPPGVDFKLSPAVRRRRTAVLEEVNYFVTAHKGEEKATICDITIELDYTRSEANPKVMLSVELVGRLFG